MELQITESENINNKLELELKHNLGIVYIDTRFDDLPDNFMHNPKDIDLITEFLEQYGRVSKTSYGHEISLKIHKPHCHIRFEVVLLEGKKKVPTAISQTFKYFLKKKSRHVYNFKFSTAVPKGSLSLFFQYVYKDYSSFESIEFEYQFGFTMSTLRDFWCRAVESRRITIAQFEKHEKKKNNEILEWDKLTQFLDSHDQIKTQVYVDEYRNEISHREEHHGTETFSSKYELKSFRMLQHHIATLIFKYYIINHDSKFPYGNKIIQIIYRYLSNRQILAPEDLATIILKY